ISNQQTDLLIIFPENFDEAVANFDSQTSVAPAPNIELWANFARTESGEAQSILSDILYGYHHELTHRFTLNAPSENAPDGDYNLATDADMFAMLVGMIVPLLFIIFIYTGCQSIAPESIAGEKERGTLGSILVTPANRRDIALGKILGIAVFAVLSAVVSMLGALLAMPNMMGLESGNIFEFYSVTDFILLLLVVTSTSLVFVSLLSVLSACSKSVKEATAYATPIMLLVFVAGLIGMIAGRIPTETTYYLIPIANSSLSINSIFSFEINVLNILTTIIVNLSVSLIFTVILAQIFNSEKIVFDK
ncbi:MAG: ABC transporter permease subunit, partial [Clostridiales bacterium]|nr:ABC transporter permease subunit [Clostridiales bacterium]